MPYRHHPQEAQMLACVARKVTVYAVCLCFFSILNVAADSVVRNVTPLTQGIGLPVLFDAPLSEGEQQVTASYNQSSFFVASNSNNRLFMDGELQQLELAYKAGWKNWQWYTSVPFIRYSGGVLDGFIDGWHEFFGLPDAGRPNFARNQLNFYYRTGNQTWRLNQSQQNIGAARLAVGKTFGGSFNSTHSFYIHAKVPTSSDIFFSVPSYDMSALLNHQLQKDALKLTVQHGVMFMLGANDLPLRKAAIVANAQLDYRVSQNLYALLQFDFHSRLYNEAGRFFRKGGLLGMGFYYQPNKIRYNAILVEDIITESSADVSFVFAVQRYW